MQITIFTCHLCTTYIIHTRHRYRHHQQTQHDLLHEVASSSRIQLTVSNLIIVCRVKNNLLTYMHLLTY